MTSAKAVALHERIRSEIEQRIFSGEWPPGHRIPFEHELMRQYDCSRMTVSKAISGLANAGLVVRRRRAGSFVGRPHLQSAVLNIPDIEADITQRGHAYRFELVSVARRRPRRRAEREVELAGKGELLAIRGRHLAGGEIFALEDRLISLATVPEAADVDFSTIAPGTWLLHHVAWTQAEHRITAVNVDRATAGLLRIRPSAACLAVDRRTWRGGRRVTDVRQLFPGDAYELVAQFSPRGT
ncbi:MAG TPA: histidine utilization repressor [Steroidobacteraceae bacterium]|nr:histidine utilization repressor [Steroidobacteraceae bacterium]